MSPGPEDQWRPPEPPRTPRPGPSGNGGSGRTPTPRPRWVPWIVVGLLIAVILVWQAAPGSTPARTQIDYSTFLQHVTANKVESIKYDASNGKITGKFAKGFTEKGNSEFTTQGPIGTLPDADIQTLQQHHVDRNYKPRSTTWAGTVLVWVVPLLLFGAIFFVCLIVARHASSTLFHTPVPTPASNATPYAGPSAALVMTIGRL